MGSIVWIVCDLYERVMVHCIVGGSAWERTPWRAVREDRR
jgi:hypothetical protein